MDVITIAKVPSKSDFRDDIKGLMLESLKFFNRTGTPFLLNMFPIQMVRDVLNYPIEFTFFDNMSNFKIQDGNVTYTNAVELMIDSIVWAIKKAGYPDMKIMIGQIGWPTDGYPYANLKNAERFHKGLLKFIASNKGTPLRPGPIDTYLHSLSDETEFRTKFGAFQRHWGIYEADGNPKYKIDFSLQDRDEYPTQAKGIVTMPNRWCMFDGDKSNMDLAKKNYNIACEEADCTKLEQGASCGELSDESKISYAFNAYFQKNKQSEEYFHIFLRRTSRRFISPANYSAISSLANLSLILARKLCDFIDMPLIIVKFLLEKAMKPSIEILNKVLVNGTENGDLFPVLHRSDWVIRRSPHLF
ncbi:glucan endo-1,3-beta-glucosidase 8-like [Solanum tuberosum]|uniref:glucan endo-1,3-beta-glucosidase 8-like n=1 Tax=Solanum tuberosum TaxID=4113 RepID=UPI00073A0F5C|nr:PREDICTED: glucan endo-1,3-beta-glucosidase 8-like [Solanum tuberosum]